MRPVRLSTVFAVIALLLGASSLAPPVPPAASAGTTSAADEFLRQDPEVPEGLDFGGGEEPEEEPEELPEPGEEPPTMKPPPVVPDSLRKSPAATLPSGGAPMETLLVRPDNVLGRPGATAPQPPKPKSRGTPFGLHPAAIFAVLVVGHVFLVRAVTD